MQLIKVKVVEESKGILEYFKILALEANGVTIITFFILKTRLFLSYYL